MSRAHHAAPRHRQRGVALFIALIVMVVMSLAGVALIRSVDTTTSVVGNIAFRQSALLAANWAIEKATSSLYSNEMKSGALLIPNTTVDNTAQNYCAAMQDYDAAPCGPFTESTKVSNQNLPPGIPYFLQKKSNYPFVPYVDAGNNEVRYVIERMCRQTGSAQASYCDMMPPKQGQGTTVGDSNAPTLGTAPIFRVTVRVDGPSNTGTSFVQAWLR